MHPATDSYRPIQRSRPVVGMLAAIVALAGCVGGVTSAPASDTTPGPAGSPATATATPPSGSVDERPSASADAAPGLADPRLDGLDVVFGEFAISLEASVIRPGPVTLVVHNAGRLVHGFEMRPESSGSGGGDRLKIETRTFAPGETLRVEADLEPGIYEIECYVADHEERGMKVYLEVRADAPLMTSSPGGSTPGAARIVQFAFVPATLEIAVGTEVRWVNEDSAPHTVTAADGSFDSRQMDPGAGFAVTFETPGVIQYHCEIHPTMVGEVRVR